MLRRTVGRLHVSSRITTMDNGLKVVTFREKSPMSCVGVFTKIGSRFERCEDRTKGCTAILEKMCQQGNTKYSTLDLREALPLGITVTNQRELLFYNADCLRWEVEKAFDHVVSTFMDIDYDSPTALENGKNEVLNEIDELNRYPSKILIEMIHQQAWKSNTLGVPIWPEPQQLEKIDTNVMKRFVRTFIQPERMVIVGMGVEHEAMLDIVDKRLNRAFESWKPVPVDPALTTPAVYTGGGMFVENLEPPPTVVKFMEKNLTHMALMFKGEAALGPDFFALGVAQSLLGGGQAFSAGGPGKGIMTKLYREGLCRYSWLEGIETLTCAYSDAGLFGIYGQAQHEHASALYDLLVHQCGTVADRITDAHVEMAKNQHKSAIFMAVETRASAVEDIGRSVALFGEVWTPEMIKAGIEAVTLDDIRRATAKYNISESGHIPPTLVVYGDISKVKQRFESR